MRVFAWIDRLLTWLGIRHDTMPMPIQDGGELWYTVKEAEALLGVSRQRVHQYIDKGRLATRTLGRLVFVSRGSILKLREQLDTLKR